MMRGPHNATYGTSSLAFEADLPIGFTENQRNSRDSYSDT